MLAVFPTTAAADAPKLLASTTNSITPPFPYAKSPVDLFRDLLAMSPMERRNFLTNRPPDIRARILEKLREYEALDPNERELRLRATELRWYLPPLMRVAPTERAARLAAIPPDIRALVENRLMQWDLLPPPLQQEFLDNEQTLRFFTHLDFGAMDHRRIAGNDPSTNHYSWENDLARWNALPETKRRSLSDQFSQFFDLSASEKTRTLNTLSDAERAEMEKTLRTFEKLPVQQRLKCIRSFEQFTRMSSQERYDFLKNAEHWSKMSPAQRQAWRDLVAHVPQWPPLPPGLNEPAAPPLPSSPIKKKTAGTALVTNGIW